MQLFPEKFKKLIDLVSVYSFLSGIFSRSTLPFTFIRLPLFSLKMYRFGFFYRTKIEYVFNPLIPGGNKKVIHT